MRFLLVIGVLCFGCVASKATPPTANAPARRPSREATAEEMSDLIRMRFHLTNLAKGAQNTRVLTGTVFLATTGLMSGALIVNNSLRTGEPQRLGNGVLAVTGAISLIGAIGSWIFPSDAELAVESYLKNDGRASPSDRLVWGESILRRAAFHSRSSRYVVGGLLLGLGAADVVAHIAEGSTPATSFLAYKGSLFVGLGAGFLVLPRSEEMEYEAYLESKRPTEKESPVSAFVFPTTDGGAMMNVALRF